MLEFKNVEIEDKSWVDEILSEHQCPSMEYNFTTFFIWQKIYNTKIAEKDGWLFSKAGKDEDNMLFLFPVGKGDIKDGLSILEDYCMAENVPMNFHSLSLEQCEILEMLYPKRYKFSENRDGFDYIYEREALSTLRGKKLSAKRNHINRFEENNPDWSYEKMNSENIRDAIFMHNEWCEASDCHSEEGLFEESCAVRRAFKYFDELELSGGILRAGGRVVAFSIGDRLNDETFLVHIEKAFADIQGAYPMINKQFVINNCEGYKYIDREDDAGDEGLRRAKLSYRPYKMAEKYVAEEVRQQ